MLRIGLLVMLTVMLISCSSGLAPNGMTWQEYRAAEYRMKVTHNAADVSGCEELGSARGVSDDDMGGAKEDAVAKALLLMGNTILFESLWSDWFPPQRVGRAETFYAEGRVYRCSE